MGGWMSNVGMRVLASISLLSISYACVNAQTLRWIGSFGVQRGSAYDVSNNGVVVGWMNTPDSRTYAYRWHGDQFQILGTLPNAADSVALGVSQNGRVIVGVSGGQAFRWENGVMQAIPAAAAYSASADGSVIVGSIEPNYYLQRAFRWVNGNLETLNIGLDDDEFATDVSADGNVVVGWSFDRWFGSASLSFRWENGSHVVIGSLPGFTRASAVSADGRVVVGFTTGPNNIFRAFRWQNGLLQVIDNGRSTASDVSADGSIVVGGKIGASGAYAFRWTEATGLQDLNTLYAGLLGGARLWDAFSISPNGRYIVGSGRRVEGGMEEAFILDTWRTGDTNGDGCVDDNDLLAVLFTFGTPGTGDSYHEDINKDGVVDDADLLMVLFNFGSGC